MLLIHRSRKEKSAALFESDVVFDDNIMSPKIMTCLIKVDLV